MARVLIVDDSPTEVYKLAAMLEKNGHEVYKAENGADGVALAKKELPDAILMDIVMPGLNEGRILTGMDNERDIAGYYLQRGVQTVVIKMGGSHGTYIRTADDQEYRVPSYHVDHIVDTVGAGDGFAVGFTSAILDGLSLEDAARRGAAIGAMAIQVAGDNEGLPTREQLAVFQQNA